MEPVDHREMQRPIGVPVEAVKDARVSYSILPPIVCYYWSRKQGSRNSGDAKQCYGSAMADERLGISVSVRINPPVNCRNRLSSAERSRPRLEHRIREGATRQEKPVKGEIGLT